MLQLRAELKNKNLRQLLIVLNESNRITRREAQEHLEQYFAYKYGKVKTRFRIIGTK
jgi:hypothetical protein